MVRGDLTSDALAALCREAPAGATLVVFHTAVLAYVLDQEDRQAFANTVTSLFPYWICNEAPSVLPDLLDGIGRASQAGRFLMSVNRKPVDWTEPHGAAMEWIAPEAAIA